jgi:hypothetical protein
MGAKDPRVDAYVAKAAPFARPLLRHFRGLVHRGCPSVVETIKWGHPAFDHHGFLAGMAAFREHASFIFWKEKRLVADGVLAPSYEGWGQFGKVRGLADLPSDAAILRTVRAAARLNVEGTPSPRSTPRVKRPVPRTPAAFAAALRGAGADAKHRAMSTSMRREYVEWIAEAKTTATRDRRIATAVQWIAEGKRRNWKYARAR